MTSMGEYRNSFLRLAILLMSAIATATAQMASTSPRTLPETVSCMEINRCAFDVEEMQKAIGENRMQDACAMLLPSVRCLKSGFNDCKMNNVLPEQSLQAMSEQIMHIEELRAQHCGMTDTCPAIYSCSYLGDKVSKATTNEDYVEACKHMKPLQECLKEALAHCTNQGFPGATLDKMKQGIMLVEQKMEFHCNHTGTNSNSSKVVTCSSVATCASSGEEMSKALSNQDFEKGCKLLKEAYNCTKEAVADCRRLKLLPEDQLASMEQGYKSLEVMIKQYCGDENTKHVQCLQMPSCKPTDAILGKMNKFIEDEKYEEACGLMRPSYRCLMSAYEDCKNSGLWEDKIEELNQLIAPVKEQWEMYCQTGETASASRKSPLHILQLLPFLTLLLVLPTAI